MTGRELAYLTNIDRFHHEAIAAVDPRDGSIVGVGRYVRYPDRPDVAEVGFEVADELQSMGIGTALATHIVQHARANGVAFLTATTLWDNRPARAMLRRFGFRARASQGSVIELDLELDSPSVCRMAPPAPQAPNSTLRRSTTGRDRPGRAGSDAFPVLIRKECHERGTWCAASQRSAGGFSRQDLISGRVHPDGEHHRPGAVRVGHTFALV